MASRPLTALSSAGATYPVAPSELKISYLCVSALLQKSVSGITFCIGRVTFASTGSLQAQCGLSGGSVCVKYLE